MTAASLTYASEPGQPSEEPDARDLQACVGDLRAHAPLARLTLEYSESDDDEEDGLDEGAARRLVDAYWKALACDRAHGEDADAYRLYIADVVRLGVPMKRAQAFTAARAGQRERLVEGNLLLVVSVANRWSALPWRSRMDMIQEGNIGLLRAAEKFNPALGVSFAHYAYYWITRYVRNEAHRQDIPSGILPYTETNTLLALRKQQHRLQRELGRELSLTETVAFLHAEQIPPPLRRASWPSVAEVQVWLSACSVNYFSQRLYSSSSSSMAPSGHLTLGDTIAYHCDFETLIEQEDADRVWQGTQLPASVCDTPARTQTATNRPADTPTLGAMNLAQLVRVLAREHVLTPAQVELLVLRYGIAHPQRAWRAPEWWRLGQLHGFRQIALMTHMPRTTLQRRYTRLLAYLAVSSHPAAQRLQVALKAGSPHGRGRRAVVDALIYLC